MQQPYSNLLPIAEKHIEPREQISPLNNSSLSSKRFYTTCQSLLQEIIKCSGYTMVRISAETQIPLITLRRLRTGITKEPRAAAFHKIFSLYCKVCLCKTINSTG